MSEYEEWLEKTLPKLAPGAKIRQKRPRGKDIIYHVLEVVDKDQVVVKSWLPHKRRWLYEVIWGWTIFKADVYGDESYCMKVV